MRRVRVTRGVPERIVRAGLGFAAAPLGLSVLAAAGGGLAVAASTALVAVGVVAAVTGVTGLGRFRRKVRATGPEPHTARVVVRGRYEPDTILAAAGRPLRITFRREDTLACSERVVFPDFGKSAMLPPHEDVTVELTPDRPGEYEFTCQLGVLRGRLIVTGPDAGARP